jgi:hypothetical protein
MEDDGANIIENELDEVETQVEQPPAQNGFSLPGVNMETLAQAIVNMAQGQQARVEPETPAFVDPWNAETREQLSAQIFQDPGATMERLLQIAEERVANRMQPTFAAANNSAFVESQLMTALPDRYGEHAAALAPRAREFLAQTRQTQPELFRNPQRAREALEYALDAEAFRLQLQAGQRSTARAAVPGQFGSSQGAPVAARGGAAGGAQLTQLQRAAAQRMGIPPSEYAKFVTRGDA